MIDFSLYTENERVKKLNKEQQVKIKRLAQILEELYTYINENEVDKYYKDVIEECINILSEKDEKR